MYNFFVEESSRNGDLFAISGSDCNHIKNVLRMRVGDSLLVSSNGISHLCEITAIDDNSVLVKIIEENYKSTNLPIKIHLFQGLPKSDKMELIIQKSVELGVEEIIPVEMNRCVSKLDGKKKLSKVSRWQSIAESAAKQSKRNIVPKVSEVLSFKEALKKAETLDLILIPYENADGMTATKQALLEIKSGMSIGIFIGPEGGFDEKEILSATKSGGKSISLGKRILRTETAAITAVSMCMLYAEMELDK